MKNLLNNTLVQKIIKYKYVVFALILVLGAIPPLFMTSNLSGQAVSVHAVTYDETGIAPNTTFLITLPNVTVTRDARTLVSIEPEQHFTLVSTSTPEVFRLSASSAFDKNSHVAITANGKQFPFTVRDELVITGVFPAHNASHVPVNTSLVFTFNSDDPVVDFFDSMSVLRSRDGHYEYFRVLPQEGRELHILPMNPLRLNVTYDITIAPPLKDINGASLKEPFEFSFTTGERTQHTRPGASSWERRFVLAGGDPDFNVISGDAPMLSAHFGGSAFQNQPPGVSVRAYAFAGWNEYYDALNAEYVDTQNMPLVAEFEDIHVEFSNWQHLLVFPEALPVGWYYVEVSVDTDALEVRTRSILMQVSDLSVFSMTTGDEVVVWAHDIVTGQPVNGATVAFAGNFIASGRTNSDGIAHISGVQFPDLDEDSDWWGHNISKRFTVTYGNRVFVASDNYFGGFHDRQAMSVQRSYISFIYTDRDIFRTTDTINVWGVVQPRDFTTLLPENLELQLTRSRITQPVTLFPDGTFTAEIKLDNISAQWWETLQLQTSDGKVFHSRHLTVNDFVAPVFKTSVTPDASVFLLDGQTDIGATINVSMFDGTPANAYHLNVRSSNWRWGQDRIALQTRNLVTDNNGNLEVAWRITESPNTWRPRSYNFSFSSNQPSDEPLFGTSSLNVIHRDVMLTGNLNHSLRTLEVNTHSIDISEINDQHSLWRHGALRGEPLSQQVTATFTRVFFAREQVGTFYDRVHREVRNSYHFTRQEEITETRAFTTSQGSYTLRNLPTPNPREHFIVTLRAEDSLGRIVEENFTIHSSVIHVGFSAESAGIHRYFLNLNRYPENVVSDEDNDHSRERDWDWDWDWGWWWWHDSSFVDGQNTSFTLHNRGEIAENTSGFILSTVVQDGFSSVAVTTGNQVSVPFDESLLPNYILTGAFFDGRHVFALGDTRMRFDPAHRELQITLIPDSQTYAPGDEMQVTVNVTNAFTGEPATNTVVLLSVVDEAIFAVKEQRTNLLRSLYRQIFFPRIRTYTSFTQHVVSGNGYGNGGGGEDLARMDFPDTAYFAATTTDEYGNALISVTMPDSVTSWRLTSLAVSPYGHAGNTIMNVTVTLDYFVMPIVNETLIDGDSFVVGLFSAGVGVDATDPVSYRVRLVGEGVDLVREVTSTVRRYASVDFGKLQRGDYIVTVEGTSGHHRDAVQLPAQVIASGIEVSRVETFNLRDGIDIDPLRWPISIVLYNENARTYNTVLRSVKTRSWSSHRTEARLTRRFISSQDSWYILTFGQQDISDISGSQSELRMLHHAEPSVELAILAHLAVPDIVQLVFHSHRAPETAAGFLAMALTGHETDVDLTRYIKLETGLRYVDKIYLAMAMYISGDTEIALKWYDALVTNRLTEHVGVGGDVQLSISSSGSIRNRRQNTAAALMFATLTENEHAHGLALYIAQRRQSFEEPNLLEQIFYLQTFRPAHSRQASFSYQLNGERITHTITNEQVRISLNRDEFASSNFTVLSGEVFADVSFAGAPEQTALEANRRIDFTKTLTPVGSNEFEVGGLVRVTLRADLSAFDMSIGSSQLVIDDYIPTGMRFERMARTSGPGWWLSNRQGQRLQFNAFGRTGSFNGYRSLGPIVYYVRIGTPGEYVVESAFIRSATSNNWGASERSTVNVGE